MTDLPAFQFYPGDWRRDPGVQALNHEHKGVWIDLLCLMHFSPSRGVLQYPSGAPMDDEGIARNLGIPEAKWKQIRSKLLATGVAETDDAGSLVNRRMVRDEHIRRVRAEAGKLGGSVSKTQAKRKQKVPPAVAVAVTEIKKQTDGVLVEGMWTTFCEVMDGSGLRLTQKRREVLDLLWREQLKDTTNPDALFRQILSTVKASDHHMSNRDYQMPESLFRNPERRDRWAAKARDAGQSPNGIRPMTQAEVAAWDAKYDRPEAER